MRSHFVCVSYLLGPWHIVAASVRSPGSALARVGQPVPIVSSDAVPNRWSDSTDTDGPPKRCLHRFIGLLTSIWVGRAKLRPHAAMPFARTHGIVEVPDWKGWVHPDLDAGESGCHLLRADRGLGR
jgi:hypothetical protein